MSGEHYQSDRPESPGTRTPHEAVDVPSYLRSRSMFDASMETPDEAGTPKKKKKKRTDGAAAGPAGQAPDDTASNAYDTWGGGRERRESGGNRQVPPLFGENVIWRREDPSAEPVEHAEAATKTAEAAAAAPASEKVASTSGEQADATTDTGTHEEAGQETDEQNDQAETQLADLDTHEQAGLDESAATERPDSNRQEVRPVQPVADGQTPEAVPPSTPHGEHTAAADRAGTPTVLSSEWQHAPDTPPPLPADGDWLQRFRERQASQNDARQIESVAAAETEDAAATEAYGQPTASAGSREGRPAMYESDTPPGYQRSTADVSRAAWTGVLAGWWLGRRGKRRAVEQARREGSQAARRQAQADIRQQAAPRVRAAAETVVVVAASVVAFERLKPAVERRESADRPAVQEAARRLTERAAAVARPEASQSRTAERRLDKRELLAVAKRIKIEGVSVKEVYAAKRLDEEGLRAVVATYLRGGDVRQKLSRELTAKELSFERDPLFRNQRRGAELLDRAGALASRSGERLALAADKSLALAKDLSGERGSQLAASARQQSKKAAVIIASGAKQAQRDIIDGGNNRDWYSVTAVVVVWSVLLLILVL